ncbi:MAG: hypothetical protein HZA90_15035 [Verrucomicrobia bacterium]|nr:hypothetical protein [Verrucomicrobiota bacterium]
MSMIVLRFLLAGTLGLAAACPAATDSARAPQGEVVLHWHFAGLEQLLANRDAAKLKAIWSLPATANLRKQAFDQLARAPFLAVSAQTPKGTPDQAALFRPLLEDLPGAESFLDWRGPAGGATECVLAIQLPDARAKVWSANLQQALNGWKLGTLSGAADAWVWKHRDGRSACALTRASQWVVLGLGGTGLLLHADTVQRVKAGGRPGAKLAGNWLEADADLARLKPWLPPLAPYRNLPIAHASWSNFTDNVRTVVRLEYRQPHGWKGEPWLTPTSIIRDPLISFTAMNGIAPLLQPWNFFQKLALKPLPNQAMVWAQAQFPFLTHFAVPMANAGPELARVTPLLSSLLLSNTPKPRPGNIAWNTNHQSVVWSGLPMAMPQVSAIKDRKAEYLYGSFFPRMNSTNRPPPELFQQIEGRNNLVYYDWEITGERLKQWRPFYQLTDIMDNHTMPDAKAPTQVWLEKVAPLLENTATEALVTSPTEIFISRRSHSGFTGFELVTLTRWLDAPGFPKFGVAGAPRVLPRKGAPPAPKGK